MTRRNLPRFADLRTGGCMRTETRVCNWLLVFVATMAVTLIAAVALG